MKNYCSSDHFVIERSERVHLHPEMLFPWESDLVYQQKNENCEGFQAQWKPIKMIYLSNTFR